MGSGLVTVEFWTGLNPGALLVRGWTWLTGGLPWSDTPSHCAVTLTTCGVTLRSQATWEGVSTCWADREVGDRSVVLEVPDFDAFCGYLHDENDDRYGWEGLVRAVTPWYRYPARNLRALDCSQLVYGALRAGGVALPDLGPAPTPADVYRALCERSDYR